MASLNGNDSRRPRLKAGAPVRLLNVVNPGSLAWRQPEGAEGRVEFASALCRGYWMVRFGQVSVLVHRRAMEVVVK